MGLNLRSLLPTIGTVLAGLFLTVTGLGAGLIGTVIRLGGALLVSSLFTSPGRGGFKNSPRYGWDNASNSLRTGGPKPVIYGRERVAPQIISRTIDQVGQTQWLNLLYLIGEGEIEQVTDIRVSETSIEAFPDAVISVRTGTADQLVIPGFADSGIIYDASTRMDRAEQHIHECRGEVDALHVALTWQGGLFHVNSEGETRYAEWGGKFEWKFTSENDSEYRIFDVANVEHDGWTYYGNGKWYKTANSRSAYRKLLKFRFAERGSYTIRVTGDGPNDDGNDVRIPTLTSVIEVKHSQETYPGLALLGLRLPAVAQLQGSPPVVTCLVDGRVVEHPWGGAPAILTKPGLGANGHSVAWSRNPVLCLRDLLLNSTYGLGDWISEADLDDTSWEDAYDYCEETVSGDHLGLSHKRHQLDLVMDTKSQAREWLSIICSASRLVLMMSGGKLKLFADRDAASAETFSEDEGDGRAKNILSAENDDAGSLSTLYETETPYLTRANVIRVRHVDRAKDYRQQVIEVRNSIFDLSSVSGTFTVSERILPTTTPDDGEIPEGWIVRKEGTTRLHVTEKADGQAWVVGDTIKGATSGATATLTAAPYWEVPEVSQEIQLYGVTRHAEALRQARFLLNRHQMTPRSVSWRVGPGSLDLEPGDVVTLYASRIGYSAKTVRILSMKSNADGTAQIEAIEHDADVYADTIDRLRIHEQFVTPLAPSRAAPAGTDTAAAGDVDATELLPLPDSLAPTVPGAAPIGGGPTTGAGVLGTPAGVNYAWRILRTARPGIHVELSWGVEFVDAHATGWVIYASRKPESRGDAVARVGVEERLAVFTLTEGVFYVRAVIEYPSSSQDWRSVNSYPITVAGGDDGGGTPSNADVRITSDGIRVVMDPLVSRDGIRGIQIIEGGDSQSTADGHGRLVGEIPIVPGGPLAAGGRFTLSGVPTEGGSPVLGEDILNNAVRRDRNLWARRVTHDGRAGEILETTCVVPERVNTESIEVIAWQGATKRGLDTVQAPNITKTAVLFRLAELPDWDSSGTSEPEWGHASWGGCLDPAGPLATVGIGAYMPSGYILTDEVDLGATMVAQPECWHHIARSTPSIPWQRTGWPWAPGHNSDFAPDEWGPQWYARESAWTSGEFSSPERLSFWEVRASNTSETGDWVPYVPGMWLEGRYWTMRLTLVSQTGMRGATVTTLIGRIRIPTRVLHGVVEWTASTAWPGVAVTYPTHPRFGAGPFLAAARVTATAEIGAAGVVPIVTINGSTGAGFNVYVQTVGGASHATDMDIHWHAIGY